MLRYLVQVIENVSITAIVVALLWAVIDREGGEKRRRRCFWGCAAGAAAALILAVLRRTTALINRAIFNAWTLSFAIILGILFVLLQWGILQKLFQKIPFLQKRPSLGDAIADYISALLLGALLFYGLPTIFLYPTEFALTGESILSTDFLFKLIGYTGGLAVAGLTGLALFKTGKRLPGITAKVFLTVILIINIAYQAVVIVQFLFARRIVPIIRWVFGIVVAVVNNSILFIYGFMGLGFLLALILFLSSLKSGLPYNNPTQRRKIRAGLRTNRRWCLTVAAGFALSVFCLSFVKNYNQREVTLSPAEPMTIRGAEITIPIEQIEDGHLHRFVYKAADNIEMRFIVIKKNAAAYGVGLDACDICGPTGYYERKNEVICRLCDVVMNISTIGFKGGCNPVPLAYTLRSGVMVINTGDLENERNRFK
jgi:uncharacterized membrane protein